MRNDHNAAKLADRPDHSPDHDPVEWIEARLSLRQSDSTESLYNDMESQSGGQLPVIYQPFDGRRRGHFVDEGSILDYVLTTNGGRVLDFGPGDGWPSLRIAPFVDEVVGVDGSTRRVDVCADNARRLGINNARFAHVPPRRLLPFEDESFDSVTAASSIEQTPDPEATLRELCRVLKPGGRMRMHYESLGRYRGGHERGVYFDKNLVIFDRYIDEEYVRHYSLRLGGSVTQLPRCPSCADLTESALEALRPHVIETTTWTTHHPSCSTLLAWLSKAGFSAVTPTYNGGGFAGSLFDVLPESQRPQEIAAVEELLRSPVQVVTTMRAPREAQPGEWDPMVVAVK